MAAPQGPPSRPARFLDKRRRNWQEAPRNKGWPADAIVLRTLFILLILAGAALGIAYPLAAGSLSGYTIGVWRVYDRTAGYAPAEASLSPSDAPVTVSLDVATKGPVRFDGGTLLTLTADTEGKTVLARTLDFTDAVETVINPQSGLRVYHEKAGRIAEVAGDRYVFTIGPGDTPSDAVETVDLKVEAGAFDLDPRTTPAGYVLMAVGLVGLIASFGRKRPKNPNSSEPQRKWGRE